MPGAAPSQGVDFATATQVMESHGQEIRRRYRGVTGMEITTTSGAEALPKDRRFVIGVYLKSEEDVPEGAQSIAGVPLTFIVTGVVTPQPAPSGG